MQDCSKKGRNYLNIMLGEKHPRSKFLVEDIVAIRKDPRQHATVAREYGVNEVTIAHIRKYRTWRHVSDP
jgi:hypothetical protein